MNRFMFAFVFLVSCVPSLSNEAEAGLFFRRCGAPRTPVCTVVHVAKAVVRAPFVAVGAWSRSRAARGLPPIFPAVAEASGATRCCSCSVKKPSFGAAPPNSEESVELQESVTLSRKARAEKTAGMLDLEYAHRFGKGPLHRAMHASPERQRRIVEKFNSTIGARSGTIITSLTGLIEWVATHPDQIRAVIQLVVEIIGLF